MAVPAAVAAALHGPVGVAVQGDAGHLADALAEVAGADLGFDGSFSDLDAVVGPHHEIHHVVDGLARVRHVLANELGAHAAAAADAELLDDLAHIVRAEALVDEELGIAVAHILSLDLAGLLAALLHDIHFGTALGRGQGALNTGMAAAEHENLGVHGGHDLIIGDLWRGAEPIYGAAIAVHGADRAAGLAERLFVSGLRLGCATHEAGGGGEGSCSERSSQKRSAVHRMLGSLNHDPLPFFVRSTGCGR